MSMKIEKRSFLILLVLLSMPAYGDKYIKLTEIERGQLVVSEEVIESIVVNQFQPRKDIFLEKYASYRSGLSADEALTLYLQARAPHRMMIDEPDEAIKIIEVIGVKRIKKPDSYIKKFRDKYYEMQMKNAVLEEELLEMHSSSNRALITVRFAYGERTGIRRYALDKSSGEWQISRRHSAREEFIFRAMQENKQKIENYVDQIYFEPPWPKSQTSIPSN
jgi:hypothetical protein